MITRWAKNIFRGTNHTAYAWVAAGAPSILSFRGFVLMVGTFAPDTNTGESY